MKYFIATDQVMNKKAVVFIDDNETMSWTTEMNEQYLAWLAEGNTPEEWNPNGNL